MNILALDAATEACSAALLADGEVRERFQIAPREHARLLLPMARELLSEAGLDLAALDAVAVGRGPGAFTGVRIAMGLAQGLAVGAAVPIAPISCLQALAYRTMRRQAAQRVLAVQDARMQEVYWAAYAAGEAGAPRIVSDAECVSRPESLAWPGDAIAWHAAGNGWAAYPEQLASLRAQSSGEPQECHPHAEDIARLAAPMVESGEALPPEQAAPSYVRDEVVRR